MQVLFSATQVCSSLTFWSHSHPDNLIIGDRWPRHYDHYHYTFHPPPNVTIRRLQISDRCLASALRSGMIARCYGQFPTCIYHLCIRSPWISLATAGRTILSGSPLLGASA